MTTKAPCELVSWLGFLSIHWNRNSPWHLFPENTYFGNAVCGSHFICVSTAQRSAQQTQLTVKNLYNWVPILSRILYTCIWQHILFCGITKWWKYISMTTFKDQSFTSRPEKRFFQSLFISYTTISRTFLKNVRFIVLLSLHVQVSFDQLVDVHVEKKCLSPTAEIFW